MAAPGPSQQPAGTQDDKQLGGLIRGLKNRAHHDKHTLVSMEDNQIVTMLQEANQYVEQVTRPRDVAADAELFNFLAESAQQYVHKLKQGGRAHSAADLLRRLKTRFVEDVDAQLAGEEDPDAFDWAGLGQGLGVALLFRSVPATHHMLGPLDAQPRQRRAVQRQAKRKAPVGPADRPEELTTLEDGEKQETDRNMEAMWHLLKDIGGRVRLLDLVLNPASFAQTVENQFALSFLVRDGRVALEPDEERGIMVQQRHITKDKDVKEKNKDEDKTQFIIPLTIEIWEDLVQAAGPDFEPLMKHRKEHRAQQEQHQQQQQQEQQQEGSEEEEDEEEEARPRQQKRPRQARGKQQQRQQQFDDEEAEQQEQQEQQEQPSARRKSRSKTPLAASAQRQQQQQQPQAEDEEQQQEEQRPSTRRKSRSKTPQALPAKRQQQQQQQQQADNRQQQQQQQQAAQQRLAANGSAEVIEIEESDSVIDLLDSDDDVAPVATGRRGATPLQQVQVKQEQPTQGKLGGSQRASQRGPMRGRR